MATIKANLSKVTGEVMSYRVRILLGYDEKGNQVRKSVTIKRPEGMTPAKEKKEVQRIANEIERKAIDEFQNSVVITAEKKENITLVDFIDKVWMPDHVHDGTHTPDGISSVESIIKYIKPYFGASRLRDIDAHALLLFVKYLRTEATTKAGKHFADSTVQRIYNVLRNIINYAEVVDYIEVNPFRKLRQSDKPTSVKKELEAGEDFLTPQQASEFIQAIEKEPIERRALVMTLLYTGVRRGELCGFQWGDINEVSRTIKVQRNVTRNPNSTDKIHIGQTKTKSTREIPISNELFSLLQEWKKEQSKRYDVDLMPNAFIFSRVDDPYRPMCPTNPTVILSRLEKRYGLPKVSPHDFRHTFGTMANAAGGLKSAQILLGHSNISTTAGFYVGVSDDQKHDVVSDIEKLIKKA